MSRADKGEPVWYLAATTGEVEQVLSNLLYGHVIPHKEGTSDPVHKVVIAADEYLATQVVAHA